MDRLLHLLDLLSYFYITGSNETAVEKGIETGIRCNTSNLACNISNIDEEKKNKIIDGTTYSK